MLKIVENALTAETYGRLRDKVQFRSYSPDDAAAALRNSLFTTEVREDTETLGIARVVGDGRIVFFIKDVVVDPTCQGRGSATCSWIPSCGISTARDARARTSD